MSQEISQLLSKVRECYVEDDEASVSTLATSLRGVLHSAAVTSRGSRFNHDEHDICLFIKRSKNQNVVVYQAHYDGVATSVGCGAAKLQKKDALQATWVKLEPEHVARRRERGEEGDRCDLKFIERKMAFGCSSSAVSEEEFGEMYYATKEKDGKMKKASYKKLSSDQKAVAKTWVRTVQPQIVKFVALPHHPLLLLSLSSAAATSGDGEDGWLKAADSVPLLLGIINNKVCVLDSLFVSSIEPTHFYELPKVEYIDFFGATVPSVRPAAEGQELIPAGAAEQERMKEG